MLAKLWYNTDTTRAEYQGAFCSSAAFTNLFCGQSAPFYRTCVLAARVVTAASRKGRFAMNRDKSYRKFWQELIGMYGQRCYYCRVEIATTIDHVIPYSYDMDNTIENLVPACGLCNCLAGNRHFESVEEKRQYILKKRKEKNLRRAFCIVCLVPYAYKLHSPSLLLCPECYDADHRTSLSDGSQWRRWLLELKDAGIPIEAHRAMRDRLKGVRHLNKDVRTETLIDEYQKIFEADKDFMVMIL